MIGKVVKVSGPLVVATGLADANMSDVVRVGPQRLIGEILTMKGDTANIQVYEETSGLGPGAEVETTTGAYDVGFGPGMIEAFFEDTSSVRAEKIVEKRWRLGALTAWRSCRISGTRRSGSSTRWLAVRLAGRRRRDILGTTQETAAASSRITAHQGALITLSE